LGSVNFTAFYNGFALNIWSSSADDGDDFALANISEDDALSTGTIASIVIGSVIGFGLIVGLCYYAFMSKSKGPFVKHVELNSFQ
jgi:hypothetical protein